MKLILNKTFLSFVISLVFSVFAYPTPTYAQQATYSGNYKECRFTPNTISPGGTVSMTVVTSSAYELHANTIVENRTINKSYPSSVAPSIDENSQNTTRTITLGPFSDLGQYFVRSQDLRETRNKCEVFPAFTVNTSSTVTLVQPVSPVALTDPDTLPTLSIAGLTSGWQYTIKLAGWKGADLDNRGGNGKTWTATGGTITATNICNDGSTNRTDCTDPFGSGIYGLTIFQLNGVQVKYLEFCIGTISSCQSGSSGKNPCFGGTCVTAIGKIPTNPTAFTGRILDIALGLAGGIALIIMVIGSVKVLMSAGDQQKLNNGRDMIIAAVAGLLFLIFSVLILRFLGNELLGLKIPIS